MAMDNAELLKRLLATFRQEAGEHLQAISAGLAAMEADPAATAAQVETIFREVHSFKGAARAVNLGAIEALCQALESVFAALKSKARGLDPALFDLLRQAVDALYVLNEKPAEQAAAPGAEAQLTARLRAAAAGQASTPARPRAETPKASPPPPPEPAAPPVSKPASAPDGEATVPPPPAPTILSVPATVRVTTAKLDQAMREAEELLGPRLAAHQRVSDLRQALASIGDRKKRRVRLQTALRQVERARNDRSGRSLAARDKELQSILNHLDEESDFVGALEDWLRRIVNAAARDERVLATLTGAMQDAVKEMQLLPFAALLDLMPRVVRELARDQGKNADFTTQGGDIEIDRRILDELKDPLIHLLRNAVDHGIEAPETRTAAGKPARGQLSVTVTQQEGGHVELRVGDDGAGISAERVAAAARKLGLIGQDEKLGEREALALVQRSGLSTSPIVTDISGRGLGLAIVREKVEHLGGTMTIESHLGRGTAFVLRIPVTLATFRAALVRSGASLYALPAAGVERVVLAAETDVRTVENRETITIDGQVVAVAHLDAVLELPAKAPAEAPARLPLVVVTGRDTRLALRVDEIVGEQEILVKPLGPQLARVRNVAGATTLGNGQVIAVLNIADLIATAARSGAPRAVATAPAADAAAAPQAILVAEDSITSRALLKGILESAGYAVTTAVDGAEAFATLKSAHFDLLVSDVEMPRMDGFDLTARVRADKKLAELPVVLVTALGTREHRERGIDVGANAYIVKSSFDQSNLLETVRRLL